MSLKKKILAFILAIFVLIQFIRPAKNQGSQNQPGDIFSYYPAPDSVKTLLRMACYDCHSNHTNYPWYTNIQPIGLWMQHHVNEGKAELNLSEFAAYSAKKGNHKLEESVELVEKREMPISSYTIIHKDADLTDQQRKMIIGWLKSIHVK